MDKDYSLQEAHAELAAELKASDSSKVSDPKVDALTAKVTSLEQSHDALAKKLSDLAAKVNAPAPRVASTSPAAPPAPPAPPEHEGA